MALHAYYLGHQKSASLFNPLDPLIMLKELADLVEGASQLASNESVISRKLSADSSNRLADVSAMKLRLGIDLLYGQSSTC